MLPNGVAALVRSVLLESKEAAIAPEHANTHIARLLSSPPDSINVVEYYQQVCPQILYALSLNVTAKREVVSAAIRYEHVHPNSTGLLVAVCADARIAW
jgi:hypothetical protein